MGTDQVWQELRAAIGMPFYFQKDEPRGHKSCCVLVFSRLSIAYVNRVSREQKNLDSRASNRSVLAKTVSFTSPFEVHLYFHALIFLEA